MAFTFAALTARGKEYLRVPSPRSSLNSAGEYFSREDFLYGFPSR